MKTSETRDRLVNQCVAFMRVLVDEFGEEEGEKMWDTICDTLPKGVRTQLLMKMIAGDFLDKVVINHAKMSAEKVPMIKALRQWDSRKMGLKEAKELVDALTGTGYSEGKQRRPITIHIDPANRNEAINQLSAAGFVI